MRKPSIFQIANYQCLHRIPLNTQTCAFDATFVSELGPPPRYAQIISNLNASVQPRLLKALEYKKWSRYRLIALIVVLVVVNILAGILLAITMNNRVPTSVFAGSLILFSIIVGLVAGISAKKSPPAMSVILKQVVEDVNMQLDTLNRESIQSDQLAWSLVGEFEDIGKRMQESNKSNELSTEVKTYILIWIKRRDRIAIVDGDRVDDDYSTVDVEYVSTESFPG